MQKSVKFLKPRMESIAILLFNRLTFIEFKEEKRV